jgi:hypothetical protein
MSFFNDLGSLPLAEQPPLARKIPIRAPLLPCVDANFVNATEAR